MARCSTVGSWGALGQLHPPVEYSFVVQVFDPEVLTYERRAFESLLKYLLLFHKIESVELVNIFDVFSPIPRVL